MNPQVENVGVTATQNMKGSGAHTMQDPRRQNIHYLFNTQMLPSHVQICATKHKFSSANRNECVRLRGSVILLERLDLLLQKRPKVKLHRTIVCSGDGYTGYAFVP